MTSRTDQLVIAARKRIVEIAPHDFAGEAACVLIDVREPAEFASGHLPGAVNIPRGVLEFQVGSHPSLEDPRQPLVVYCRSGGRAALAALTLAELGFGNVRSLAGGIMGWSDAALPVHVPEPGQ